MSGTPVGEGNVGGRDGRRIERATSAGVLRKKTTQLYSLGYIAGSLFLLKLLRLPKIQKLNLKIEKLGTALIN